MNLQELRLRIAKWEDLHTEFKEYPVDSDDLVSSIVALANTDGGQLILGVTKDRAIRGVGDADLAAQRIDQIAFNNCEPPITVIQEVIVAEPNRNVLVVNIPKGDQRPYRTNPGLYYVRTSSGRRHASREELLRLFQTTESLYYDETPVLRTRLSDVDTHAFERFSREAYGRALADWEIPLETLLRNWNLLRGEHPTLACMIFFSRQPQDFLPNAFVTAARIPGRDLTPAPSDQKRLDGPMLVMFDDAVRFLRLHLKSPHVIQGFAPETHPELPEEALREAVLNALAHRDYTVQGPIRLFIFDDRVEVRSPGRLPNTVTIEAMRLGAAHILRNPTMYALLNRLGRVTDIGSGVFRMIQRVRKATGKDVGLEHQGPEFVVTLPRPHQV